VFNANFSNISAISWRDNFLLLTETILIMYANTMKGVNFSCLKISNIPYNSIFTQNVNDSSILITIISGAYLNLFVQMNALVTSQYQGLVYDA
jgi:hypothetical protein